MAYWRLNNRNQYFFKVWHRPGESFLCCAQFSSFTSEWLPFILTCHTCTIVWLTTKIEKVDKFNIYLMEKILLSVPGLDPKILQPGRSLMLPHHRKGLASFWHPLVGPFYVASTLGDLLVVAGWMINQAFQESIRQERIGVHGFTYNPALLGPPM